MNTIDYKIGTGGEGDDPFFDQVRTGDLEQVRPLPRISIHAFCETNAMQQLM